MHNNEAQQWNRQSRIKKTLIYDPRILFPEHTTVQSSSLETGVSGYLRMYLLEATQRMFLTGVGDSPDKEIQKRGFPRVWGWDWGGWVAACLWLDAV